MHFLLTIKTYFSSDHDMSDRSLRVRKTHSSKMMEEIGLSQRTSHVYHISDTH